MLNEFMAIGAGAFLFMLPNLGNVAFGSVA
jgi:hypothetical protein